MSHRYSVHRSVTNGHDHSSGWYGSEADPVPSSSQSSPHTFQPERAGLMRDEGSVLTEVSLRHRYVHGHRRLNQLPPESRSRPAMQREPREKHDGGRDSRSVTPPPVPEPSATYLELAQEPSTSLSDPSSTRKLLILDLNGTLVHRSPHSFRGKGRYDPPTRDAGPRLRPVHPRPYMEAFRVYLFAPETRSWLDVMVWSSAQPHSVADMVDKCFGKRKDELIAVWARDTLGLSDEHYNRKIQTLKDLSKPWSQLPALLTPLPPSPHSSQASTPRSSPVPDTGEVSHAPSSTYAGAHSALTTLLLDDSPLKAALQPYNHVCICEYTAEMRARDLEKLQKLQQWQQAMANAQTKQENAMAEGSAAEGSSSPVRSDYIQGSSSQKTNPDDYSPPVPAQTRRKRKLKQKFDGLTANGAATVAAAVEDAFSSSSSPIDAAPPPPSSTLVDEHLDVDGTESKRRKRKSKRQKRLEVLEALAQDSKARPPEQAFDETLLAVIGVLDEIKCQSNVAAWIRAGGLWGPVGKPKPRKLEEEDKQDVTPAAPDGDGDAEPRKKRKERKRERRDADGAVPDAAPEGPAGNDEVTTAAVDPDPKNGEETRMPMWFESPDVLAYWIPRGRRALEALGIPVVHGLER